MRDIDWGAIGFGTLICLVGSIIVTVVVVTLDVVFNPASPLEEARNRFSGSCAYNEAVPNTASDDPKEWTCEVVR
jgi:hypothetical protein